MMNFLLFASAALLLGAAVQGQTPPESEIVATWQLASLGEATDANDSSASRPTTDRASA